MIIFYANSFWICPQIIFKENVLNTSGKTRSYIQYTVHLHNAYNIICKWLLRKLLDLFEIFSPIESVFEEVHVVLCETSNGVIIVIDFFSREHLRKPVTNQICTRILSCSRRRIVAVDINYRVCMSIIYKKTLTISVNIACLIKKTKTIRNLKDIVNCICLCIANGTDVTSNRENIVFRLSQIFGKCTLKPVP